MLTQSIWAVCLFGAFPFNWIPKQLMLYIISSWFSRSNESQYLDTGIPVKKRSFPVWLPYFIRCHSPFIVRVPTSPTSLVFVYLASKRNLFSRASLLLLLKTCDSLISIKWSPYHVTALPTKVGLLHVSDLNQSEDVFAPRLAHFTIYVYVDREVLNTQNVHSWFSCSILSNVLLLRTIIEDQEWRRGSRFTCASFTNTSDFTHAIFSSTKCIC